MQDKATNKSPVFAYLQRASLVDFPGKLAAVMFTSGCNFKCGFCHNATLMGKTREGLSWARLEQACRQFHEQWANAVVISGGEPTLWGEDLTQLIKFFRRFGFAVKLDTNGSRPAVLEQVLPLLDYVAMDIKCSPDHYREYVGFPDRDAIRQSVRQIITSGVPHEFRTTVVEPFHTDDHALAMAGLIQGAKRYVLQPFLPREDLPGSEFRKLARTSPDRLMQLQELMRHCADEVVVR